MNKVKSFKGLNGKIVIKEDYVSIVREAMIDSTFHEKGEIKIPYAQIKEIEVVPGGILNGYITIFDGKVSKPLTIFSALKNEKTIIFRMTKNGEAEKIKREILRKGGAKI